MNKANQKTWNPFAYSAVCNGYYNNFIGHCGAFCGLKWRIERDKIYLSPLLWANEKQENNVTSQSETGNHSTVRAVFLFVWFCLIESAAISKENAYRATKWLKNLTKNRNSWAMVEMMPVVVYCYMAGSEVNVKICLRRAKSAQFCLSLAIAQLIVTLVSRTISSLFTNFCCFSFENLEAKIILTNFACSAEPYATEWILLWNKNNCQNKRCRDAGSVQDYSVYCRLFLCECPLKLL